MNDTKSQAEKFREAATAAGADESEEHFKARLRKVAQAKVTSEPPSEPPTTDDQEDDEK